MRHSKPFPPKSYINGKKRARKVGENHQSMKKTQIKTPLTCHLTPLGMLISKTVRSKCQRGCQETDTQGCCLWEWNTACYRHKNIKHRYHKVQSLHLPKLLKELHTLLGSFIHNSLNTEAKQRSTNKWMDREMRRSLAMKYYTALKRRGYLAPATTWMYLEDFMRRKMSQSQENNNAILLVDLFAITQK